ncbi:MAG: hypothetical protein ABW006_09080 [Hyphomicrobium sp.]
MKSVAVALLAFATFATATFASSGVRAEDFNSAADSHGALSAKVDKQIDQAVNSSDAASSADVDARIKDLESTRTAIDQKTPPKVSLGVSGWVSQEVQYFRQ